ncbi:MAG: N-6 DNA methylase [Oscillospiraceae bacterium]|jgi:type I restriction-modification system DNA methylase subunit|nr:N-6 DNA methylase [Oscillospiraceae bacterium]
MTDAQQKSAAKKFAKDWKDKGYERGQSQPFWLSLLRDVYGVENPEQYILFEERVVLDNTSFIDATIPATKVLIEQKGLGKDLKKTIRQSDGTLLTPFQQAKRYISELPLSQHPRWVITCNFSTFHVYDMERPGGEPEIIQLENLPSEYYRLSFLTDKGNEKIKREMEVSFAAGKIVGLIYDSFSKQYVNPESERALHSLNVLCVRLVFCLYAEDAGIFGHKSMFHNYLGNFETKHLRKALIEFFQVLDTKPENRDPYLDPTLAAFPYVNGDLFADENIEIPQFTDEIKDLLLNKASSNFNWSEISPTIFGAVFESTLNPETRRSGGMHYTSLENIHKVIDPLFYDDLKSEFEDIRLIAIEKTKNAKLLEFQKKLASLAFLDPACGSGNFLTETYICLRQLENELLSELQRGQITIGEEFHNPIKVSIKQFYGIEINDFAVTVAKTALWIAESQMMKETEMILHMQLNFLPLKSYANIVEGNALQIDWEDVVPKNELDHIMGNPPFLGYAMQNAKQKADAVAIFGKIKLSNSIDYVGAWYHKAAQYISDTKIRVAFVSTNSITQGEQVAPLWEKMLNEYGVHIDFAYRTFKWSSEANEKAAVHCVIVGISKEYGGQRVIYDGETKTVVSNINPYLVNAPNVLILSRSKPICDALKMVYGNMPNDNGQFILSAKEKEELIASESGAERFIKPFISASDFINGKKRYCLWLKDVSFPMIKSYPLIQERIKKVREFRLKSTAKPTVDKAETPHMFFFSSHPDTDYILIPRHSSEKRRYIPIGFVSPDIVSSDANMIIPNAALYHFGIITSNVHMAWVRTVCGRIKSDYRYSGAIVYNNFPWPDATDEQKNEIEKLAQAVLDAREEYPDSTLADMYGETSMLFHTSLLNAHRELDKAVMKLYGFPVKDFSEADCVAALMERYQELVGEKK